MPPKKHPTIWKAEHHTIAKIEILQEYLKAWFSIMGINRYGGGQDILYIDGFAGPGEYTNYPTGSPIAALEAADSVLKTYESRWKAGDVHCAFIDSDAKRMEHLRAKAEGRVLHARIHTYFYEDEFVDGLAAIQSRIPGPFVSDSPLFAFIDPFGAKGVPFASIQNILLSRRSEVLLNLDADGIARIFQAGQDAKSDIILNDIFGGNSWQAIPSDLTFDKQCREVLNIYKACLRGLERVRYVFPFEMRSTSCLNYFLVFASQHRLGLEKMKQAMKKIDQTGEYKFSDADLGQQLLFRFDDPKDFSRKMFTWCRGTRRTYKELMDYALNETPFINPKKMLKHLEEHGCLAKVETAPGNVRRKGTFSEDAVVAVHFKQEVPDAEG